MAPALAQHTTRCPGEKCLGCSWQLANPTSRFRLVSLQFPPQQGQNNSEPPYKTGGFPAGCFFLPSLKSEVTGKRVKVLEPPAKKS